MTNRQKRKPIFLRDDTHARLKAMSDDSGISMSEITDRIMLNAISEWKPGDPPPKRLFGENIPRGYHAIHPKKE